ncbi:MAG: winged helix DNA-binding domain-containing protein, partial [Kofleriaceae bacterium]
MKHLSKLRLVAQRLVGSTLATPLEVARWMLAVQAQDLSAAKWALGMRAPGTTVADVDAALANGSIVRSWPMRGTLHLTPAEDLKWMLALATPRVLAGAKQRQQALQLDAKTFSKARDVAHEVLAGKKQLTRSALLAAFNAAKLDAEPHRGYHILWYLAQTGSICLGPSEGKDQSYVLCDEWIAAPRELLREESLGELARRYFLSHGPATLKDLARWAKLTMPDARVALELAKPALAHHDGYYFDEHTVIADDSSVLALPAFDELILGYEDRTCSLPARFSERVVPGGNGVFLSTIVVRGEVVGTWARTQKAKEVVVEARPFTKLTVAATKGFERALT